MLHAPKHEVEPKANCDLCGGWESQWRLTGRGRTNDAGLIATYLCTKCGWIYKVATKKWDIAAQYAEKGGHHTYDAESETENFLRSDEVFDYVNNYVRQSPGPRTALDVGGGIGQVSVSFARRGWHVTIVDLGDGDPIHERMVKRRCPFDDFHSDDGFDAVFLSHVLEHVTGPTAMLSRAVNQLKQEGLLYVEVPFEIFTPVIKRKLGDAAHVGYFQVSTLKDFLTKLRLDVLDLRLTMGRYNKRRLPVIRAIARKGAGESAPASRLTLQGLTRLCAAILNPRNLALVMFAKAVSRGLRK
jgi:SAM-dependent methyltransferase